MWRVRRPHSIDLELTNACNMTCPHCHRSVMQRSEGFMSERLFCKLIDEVARYRHCNLCMVGLGEPGLHPKLDTICRAPKEIFAVEKARRPRGRYTLRQNIRVLDRWPPH
jgi:MoaA/NifB/PqqE/SkfB family radical SAM enzyme